VGLVASPDLTDTSNTANSVNTGKGSAVNSTLVSAGTALLEVRGSVNTLEATGTARHGASGVGSRAAGSTGSKVTTSTGTLGSLGGVGNGEAGERLGIAKAGSAEEVSTGTSIVAHGSSVGDDNAVGIVGGRSTTSSGSVGVAGRGETVKVAEALGVKSAGGAEVSSADTTGAHTVVTLVAGSAGGSNKATEPVGTRGILHTVGGDGVGKVGNETKVLESSTVNVSVGTGGAGGVSLTEVSLVGDSVVDVSGRAHRRVHHNGSSAGGAWETSDDAGEGGALRRGDGDDGKEGSGGGEGRHG